MGQIKLKISGKQVLADLRAGIDDAEIMAKY